MEQMSLGSSSILGTQTIMLSRVQSLPASENTAPLQFIGAPNSNRSNEEHSSISIGAGMDSGILPFLETDEEGGQVIFRGTVDPSGAVILDASQFAAFMNSINIDQSTRENLPIVNQSSTYSTVNMGSAISTGKTLPLISSRHHQRLYFSNQSKVDQSTFPSREILSVVEMQPEAGQIPSTAVANTNSESISSENLQHNKQPTTSDESSQILKAGTSSDHNITNNLISVTIGPTSSNIYKQRTFENTSNSESVDVQQSLSHASKYIEVEPPIGRGPYRCPDCGKMIQKWPQFKRHRAEHLDEKSHRCSLCSMSFNFETNLKLHEMIHEAESNGCLECQVCPAKFTRLASLKSHVRVHEKEENLVCPECGDEFATKSRLDTHIEDHKTTKSLLYRCRLCGKSFTQPALLKDHAKEHTAVRNQLKILNPRRRKPTVPKSSRGQPLEISKSRERVEKKKTLLCAICAKKFQKPSQLSRHIRIHTGEKPFSCKDCGRSFNQKGTLESHILSMHEKLKPYICHLCNCQFSQRGNLKAHVLKVHVPPGDDEKVFKCQECSCVYRRLATLNTHISKSHSKTSHEIPLVDDPTVTSQNIQQSASTICDTVQFQGQLMPVFEEGIEAQNINTQTAQTEANSIQTANCTSATNQNGSGDQSTPIKDLTVSVSQISEVKLAHETQAGNAITCIVNVKKIGQDKWHMCSTCSKGFRKPSDLIRHTRIHTLERPFKCHVCTKCFAVKSTLNTHMKTHSLQKDFECRICHKRFSVMTSLRAHERLHTGAKPFACLHCGKGFRTSSQRRMHTKIHYRNAQGPTGKRKLLRIGDMEPKIELPDPLKITSDGLVPVPNRTSFSIIKSNTLQDSKIRPYRCSQCPSAFKKSSHLKQHNLSHSKERPYKCYQCYRSFISSGVLKNHIKTHEGVRAYKCHVCQLSFTTNGSLTRHMVTHTDVRPFVCPYCHKTFKTSVSCRKHIKTHRSEFVAFRTNPDDIMPSSVVASASVANVGDDIQDHSTRIVNDKTFQSGYQPNEDIYIGNDDDHFEQSFGIADTNVHLRLSHHTDIGSCTPERNTLLSSLPPSGSNGMDDSIGSMQQQIQDITELIAESGQHLTNTGGEVTLQYSMPTESQIEEVAHQISLAEGQHFDGSIFNLQGGDSLELPAQLSSILPHASQENSSNSVQSSISCSSYVQTMPSNQKFNLPEETTISFNTATSKLNSEIQDQQLAASLKDNRIQELILSSKPISEQLFNKMTALPMPITNATGSKEEAQSYYEDEMENDKTKVNKCSYCGRGFRKRSDMLRHIRIHTGEKPFRCHICGKTFRVKSTREAHIKTHEGGKTVACHICHNLFSTKSSLRVHIRLHTGAKPYKCLHCERWFRTSGHRKAHAISHFKVPKDSGKLPPVETIKDKTCLTSQPLAINNYPTTSTSVADPIQILGSLQLTIDGPTVQNIQITGLDLNNFQLSEDFLQSLGNVIYMTPNQLTNDINVSNMVGFPLQTGDINSIGQLIHSQSHQDSSLSHLVNQTSSVLTGKDVNVGNTVTNIQPYNQRLLHNPDSSSISIVDFDSLTVPSDHASMCGFNSLTATAASETVSITSETQKNKDNSTSSQSTKECPTCGKTFAKPSLLKRHMRLHTGAKPFLCTVCGCTFNQKNSLRVHMLSLHSNERPFVCSLCPFKTVVKAALKKHCSRAHPNLDLDEIVLHSEPVPVPTTSTSSANDADNNQ